MDIGVSPDKQNCPNYWRGQLWAYERETLSLMRRLNHGLNNGGVQSYRRRCQCRRLQEVRTILGPRVLAELKQRQVVFRNEDLVSLTKLVARTDAFLKTVNN